MIDPSPLATTPALSSRAEPKDRLAVTGAIAVSPRWYAGKFAQYAIATIGPVGNSATQFLLSLAMLHLLAPAAFGSFTFLLVASQLSWGMWHALFCAPLPVLLIEPDPAVRETGETTLICTSALATLISVPAFAGIAAAMGLHPVAIACYAVYGAFALARWFLRAQAYVEARPIRTMISDVTYSATVLATLAIALLCRIEAQTACYGALLVGAAAGLLPFGGRVLVRQFALARVAAWRGYGDIWRSQSRWGLLGVITTEATANAHVYLITLLKGPAAFAPIAASALLVRPVNVAQIALADFERPQMARLIAARDTDQLRLSQRHFQYALALIWGATVIASFALFAFDPRLVFSKSYQVEVIETGAVLWMLVAAVRFVQVPPSTILGAAGEFRSLAFASIWSSIASVAAVALLVPLAGALWSIGGVALGALVFLIWTWRQYRAWLDASLSPESRGNNDAHNRQGRGDAGQPPLDHPIFR